MKNDNNWIFKKGDYFILEGKKYRVGNLIEGTNGYVACIGEDKKVHRFHIDMQVWRVREE